ncbi:Uncharacterised protein [Anaerococcus prevotii]|uniref:Gram-positive cocci surface proteins LPxTG domain-containing protein n=1 Tax=Anaerococcus prevotii (strain ATCC 9321 / DSM 20548 / JCM 6508 / NCTC 11806 / PC1) TaxID=525919 RepID=C7RGN0_ANAPD|nr:DUF5633 domain-containing protein [Anaerococcus prevotii]ACV28641.1 hypothetical protein Apre_0599 [Anaerococcus prevotii DSM 20548]SUU94203.1 Uncharacterised protein [Anaerococcus prevotii]
MKKNKLIGASLALALGTGLLAQPAYANAELESDLQKASELTESMKNHIVEVDKIRRGKSEEKPNDNETPSTPSKDDKDHSDDLTGGALESKGYDSKEEAETAGKKALKNSPNKKSFSVSKGVDGKYYFHLWEDGENTTDNTKDNTSKQSTKTSKEDTSKNKENNKQVANNSSNVKTGIEPLIGTAGVLVASIGALGFSKKENK